MNNASSVIYYSNAKLLLTAEYLVLKGAKALAVPLNVGQQMQLEKTSSGKIEWVSTVQNEIWFTAQFTLPDLSIVETNQPDIAKKVVEIFHFAQTLNPLFLSDSKGYKVITNVDFDMQWGLGSSSTLISNIAWWADCNPYQLNKMAFKGSGYDIACARSNKPIVYQLMNDVPVVENVAFDPPFLSNLSLVWLNQKQNSRAEIIRFDQLRNYISEIEQINEITLEMLNCKNLPRFMELMKLHENIISSVVKMPKVKTQFFTDFDGEIKSLGAWGGDFVLVATNNSFEYVQKFFNQKGYFTVVSFQSLVLINS